MRKICVRQLSIFLCIIMLVGCSNTQKPSTTTLPEKETPSVENDLRVENDKESDKGSLNNPYQFGETITMHVISNYADGDSDRSAIPKEMVLEIIPLEFSNYGLKVNLQMIKSEDEREAIDYYFGGEVIDSNKETLSYMDGLYSDDELYYSEFNFGYESDNNRIELYNGQNTDGYLTFSGSPLQGDDIPKYLCISYNTFKDKYNDFADVYYDDSNYVREWIEIPDGSYDTDFVYEYEDNQYEGYGDEPDEYYEYGASSVQEAMDMFWQAFDDQNLELAKRISFTNYIMVNIRGREEVYDVSWSDYLNINDLDFDRITETVENYGKQETNIYQETIPSLQRLRERSMDVGSADFILQDGYCYEYDYIKRFTISVLQVDNRWFVIEGMHGIQDKRWYGYASHYWESIN